MIYSMTGFSALESDTSQGMLLIELRSVNHRYLELQLKLDDSLRSLEGLVRELIAAKLGRGKVECRMSLIAPHNSNNKQEVNAEVLQQLADLTKIVQGQFPESQPLSVADVLRWPGVLSRDESSAESLDYDALSVAIVRNLNQVLDDLVRARNREGEKLKTLILERLAEAEILVKQVKPLLPMQSKAYQERLTSKLQEALKTIDEDRICQELLIFAQRSDVDEELTRLTAHIQEVKRILNDDNAAGKRLDFLMQELNREANTLGSKSVSTEVTQVSMTLKVLIEQMREQIQNIE
jgi:uncharacterized protein (TIGR00255 family)